MSVETCFSLHSFQNPILNSCLYNLLLVMLVKSIKYCYDDWFFKSFSMCLWLDHFASAQGKYKNLHLLCIYEVISFKKLDFTWFLVW